jgi:hypothetical protein
MIFRGTLRITFACGFLLCSAALAQTIKTSYRPGIDFSKYHAYKWVSVKGSQHPDPSLDARIKQVIDSQLGAKRLTRKDDSADLNVDYQIAISRQETWQTYEDWTETGLMDGRLPQRRQVTIDVGTLVLDIYDSMAKELVWTGRASKAIDSKSSEDDRKKSLGVAAQKLLKNFPPK